MNFQTNDKITQHTRDGLTNIEIYNNYNEDNMESKDNNLNFSFDHVYTITPEDVPFLQQPKIEEGTMTSMEEECNEQSTPSAEDEIETLKVQLRNAQIELIKLKKLASIHLDLIHRQNNLLTSKDIHNQALLEENEMMLQMNGKEI